MKWFTCEWKPPQLWVHDLIRSQVKKSSPLLKQSCEFRRMLSVSLSSSCFLVVVFFLLRAFVSVTVTSVYHGPRCSLCVVKPLSVMLPDFSYFLFHFGNLCPVHLVFCFTFPVFFSSLDALVFPVTWCVFIVSVSRLSFVMPSLDGCVFPYFTVPWDFYFFFIFCFWSATPCIFVFLKVER